MSGTTVHLGQFTDEHANEIAGELEKLGIAWWYKQPGYFSRIWERGTRLFVDATRVEEAKEIARRVLSDGLDHRPDSTSNVSETGSAGEGSVPPPNPR